MLGALPRVLGVLLGGARVSLVAPPAGPLGLLTLRLSEFSLTAEGGGGVLPFRSLALESAAPIQLGWKVPALLAAPAWALARPSLLPLLLVLYITLPAGPRAGTLAFDAMVSESDLNRGAWPSVLSGILSGIARSSLPGMMASLSAELDGQGAGLQLPASRCVASRVEGGKLVMDGEVELAPEQTLEFTLRTGVGARRAARGASRGAADDDRSALLWENPEIRVAPFGDQGLLGRLVPKVWLPVLSASGVLLPRGCELRRVALSDASGGAVAAGVVELDPAPAAAAGPGASAGGPPRGFAGGAPALPTGRG